MPAERAKSFVASTTRIQTIRQPNADKDAEEEGDLRVLDEGGEGYLFSADRFVAIEVPAAVKASLLKAS